MSLKINNPVLELKGKYAEAFTSSIQEITMEI